ncbi:hypothetical protein CBR_g34503 [Chara braunii]|uniref:1-phosphatidylinositol 4-kinase n=1 Tax=Chara braunii TaxID=69332 RepID=A0A388LIS4_CHABU|nr:hypothetical protein CBR_g34503 [Chara braunii]|eukprot:GBG82219.1 hypothetical protein CBR_g34503 [Chara braunii]
MVRLLPFRSRVNSSDDDAACDEIPREITKTPSKTGDSGWLLRFFDSSFFNEWIAVSYLYKHEHTGVRDYLCNRMYTLSESGVENYLFQLCYMLVHRPSASLDRYVVDMCSRSLRISIKVYWFLLAEAEDSENSTEIWKLIERCEEAVLRADWKPPFRPGGKAAGGGGGGALSRGGGGGRGAEDGASSKGGGRRLLARLSSPRKLLSFPASALAYYPSPRKGSSSSQKEQRKTATSGGSSSSSAVGGIPKGAASWGMVAGCGGILPSPSGRSAQGAQGGTSGSEDADSETSMSTRKAGEGRREGGSGGGVAGAADEGESTPRLLKRFLSGPKMRRNLKKVFREKENGKTMGGGGEEEGGAATAAAGIATMTVKKKRGGGVGSGGSGDDGEGFLRKLFRERVEEDEKAAAGSSAWTAAMPTRGAEDSDSFFRRFFKEKAEEEDKSGVGRRLSKEKGGEEEKAGSGGRRVGGGREGRKGGRGGEVRVPRKLFEDVPEEEEEEEKVGGGWKAGGGVEEAEGFSLRRLFPTTAAFRVAAAVEEEKGESESSFFKKWWRERPEEEERAKMEEGMSMDEGKEEGREGEREEEGGAPPPPAAEDACELAKEDGFFRKFFRDKGDAEEEKSDGEGFFRKWFRDRGGSSDDERGSAGALPASHRTMGAGGGGGGGDEGAEGFFLRRFLFREKGEGEVDAGDSNRNSFPRSEGEGPDGSFLRRFFRDSKTADVLLGDTAGSGLTEPQQQQPAELGCNSPPPPPPPPPAAPSPSPPPNPHSAAAAPASRRLSPFRSASREGGRESASNSERIEKRRSISVASPPPLNGCYPLETVVEEVLTTSVGRSSSVDGEDLDGRATVKEEENSCATYGNGDEAGCTVNQDELVDQEGQNSHQLPKVGRTGGEQGQLGCAMEEGVGGPGGNARVLADLATWPVAAAGNNSSGRGREEGNGLNPSYVDDANGEREEREEKVEEEAGQERTTRSTEGEVSQRAQGGDSGKEEVLSAVHTSNERVCPLMTGLTKGGGEGEGERMERERREGVEGEGEGEGKGVATGGSVSPAEEAREEAEKAGEREVMVEDMRGGRRAHEEEKPEAESSKEGGSSAAEAGAIGEVGGVGIATTEPKWNLFGRVKKLWPLSDDTGDKEERESASVQSDHHPLKSGSPSLPPPSNAAVAAAAAAAASAASAAVVAGGLLAATSRTLFGSFASGSREKPGGEGREKSGTLYEDAATEDESTRREATEDESTRREGTRDDETEGTEEEMGGAVSGGESVISIFTRSRTSERAFSKKQSSRKSEGSRSKVKVPKNPCFRIRPGSFHATLDFARALCDASAGLVDVYPLEDRQLALRQSLAELNGHLESASPDSGVCFPGGKGLARIVHIPEEEAVLLNSRDKAPFMIFVEVHRMDSGADEESDNKKRGGIPLASCDSMLSNPPPWALPGGPSPLLVGKYGCQMMTTSEVIDKALADLWATKLKLVTISMTVMKRKRERSEESGKVRDYCSHEREMRGEVMNSDVGDSHNGDAGNEAAGKDGGLSEQDRVVAESVENLQEKEEEEEAEEWVSVNLVALAGVNMEDVELDETNVKERKKEHKRVPSTVAMEEMKAATEKGDMVSIGFPPMVVGDDSCGGNATVDEADAVRRAATDAVMGERWIDKKERLRKASKYGSVPNWDLRSLIVKSGDDCRQEHLAMQLISHFHDIFGEAGLPLWLRPYEVLVTSSHTALIETIPNAVSIHAVKSRTPGSLREHFHAKYRKNSPAFKLAQRNFVESMAGYSILCYFLQIKDRHNGNILLDDEGHVIHIDFGFMLSNSPGGVNFESAPFKLTRELLEVMDSDADGSSSEPFDYFKVLCIQGFLTCRKHAERIILLVEMMQDSGCPCFKGGIKTIQNLRKRFCLSLTEEQCVSLVLSLIHSSLDAWRTRQYDYYQRVLNGIL